MTRIAVYAHRPKLKGNAADSTVAATQQLPTVVVATSEKRAQE